jgi:hypothetical protein
MGMAVCGYLQCEEQHDVHVFSPSHHECSELGHEELGKLRQEFMELVKEKRPEGLKKFAARHKRDSRCDPKEVHKCNGFDVWRARRRKRI